MRIFCLSLILIISSFTLYGQDCNILSKANLIAPDKLCSPLTAGWKVNYTGVNNAGRPVQIRYEWDDGTVNTVNATNTGPGAFEATFNHTYLSTGDKCNYRPKATLVVNGVICSSSTQEQIVTVWDNDNHNGGHMHISPTVYPICFGNGADVRFRDLTQFNCVPPQENDVPNLYTRWIQWIYGTDITMTGLPVRINGALKTFPFTAPVITLPGPVTGSGVYSDIINVANDKLIGQYFQVTLRNWNYCNPYDDPNIPGPPVDPVNGDHAPVVTTAIILIVPLPDATISPVDTLCIDNAPVTLHAHDNGGVWSGDGVNNDKFDPGSAGVGNHTISYSIQDGNGCSDADQIIITVVPPPAVLITPVEHLFVSSPPALLEASLTGGHWSGNGVNDNKFYPDSAGLGTHVITYISLPDRFGCTGMDTIHIQVIMPFPDATISHVDTLCINSAPVTLHAHDEGGVWSGDGVTNDKFDPGSAGAGNHTITYTIQDGNGYTDSDQIVITVMPSPVMHITPVGTLFINDPTVILTSSLPGGDWTGNGVNNGRFYPDSAGLGIHIISYSSLPDEFGCNCVDTIHIEVVMPPGPVAFFQPDSTGCSPLLIQFQNLSQNGISYIWDFGDNTYSSQKNPSHLYTFPGNYIVKLTVNNIAGESTYKGLIIVYQGPTAMFDIYPTDIINNSQVVVFTDYSHYAVSWAWNFGDGTYSFEENPWHKYASEGSYKVTLNVISKDGCRDSMKYQTRVNVDYKTGEIKFPNVFKWNGSGPTGGYWIDDQINDNVFRPFYTNVIEYKLQIFNRLGTLIYESTDLKKGWDGYSENLHLAHQGVYVWKVVGRFADGSYFTKVGDVSFLH